MVSTHVNLCIAFISSLSLTYTRQLLANNITYRTNSSGEFGNLQLYAMTNGVQELPDYIRVLSIKSLQNFDAKQNCKSRTYHYLLPERMLSQGQQNWSPVPLFEKGIRFGLNSYPFT